MYIKHGSKKKSGRQPRVGSCALNEKNGTTSWERLADLKDSSPVEVADYTVSKNLLHAPVFVWWVQYVLKKRSRISAARNKNFLKFCGVWQRGPANWP
jgi:hypothetical protein